VWIQFIAYIRIGVVVGRSVGHIAVVVADHSTYCQLFVVGAEPEPTAVLGIRLPCPVGLGHIYFLTISLWNWV
jgi:hypothetical protein